MRVISSAATMPHRRSIEPVERIAAVDDRRSSGDRRMSQRQAMPQAPAMPQVSLAGVVAQAVFHNAFAGRPEGSAIHANMAYRRTEEMQYRFAEPLSKVA